MYIVHDSRHDHLFRITDFSFSIFKVVEMYGVSSGVKLLPNLVGDNEKHPCHSLTYHIFSTITLGLSVNFTLYHGRCR